MIRSVENTWIVQSTEKIFRKNVFVSSFDSLICSFCCTTWLLNYFVLFWSKVIWCHSLVSSGPRIRKVELGTSPFASVSLLLFFQPIINVFFGVNYGVNFAQKKTLNNPSLFSNKNNLRTPSYSRANNFSANCTLFDQLCGKFKRSSKRNIGDSLKPEVLWANSEKK